MADILEVLHGLLGCMEHTWEELEALRAAKRQARGGFDDGIVLLEVIEP